MSTAAVAAVAGGVGAYVAVAATAEGVAGAIPSGAVSGEIQSVVTGAIHSDESPGPAPKSCP